MNTLTITASNIKCGGCASNIQNGLTEINGIENVEVDVASGVVTINGNDLNQSDISKKLTELGFPEK